MYKWRVMLLFSVMKFLYTMTFLITFTLKSLELVLFEWWTIDTRNDINFRNYFGIYVFAFKSGILGIAINQKCILTATDSYWQPLIKNAVKNKLFGFPMVIRSHKSFFRVLVNLGLNCLTFYFMENSLNLISHKVQNKQ